MAQRTDFPDGRYVQYSAPEIPKRRMHWFARMLAALAILLALGVAYGFWRISDVPNPRLEVPASDNPGVTTEAAPTRR